MTALRIDIVGAGIFGVWQALTLARAGHAVRLIDTAAEPFAAAQSRFAGAMLAPWCESETSGPHVVPLGIEGLALWRQVYPSLVNAGTLVVAAPRDRSELARFDRVTEGHERIGAERLAVLEPDLAGRFAEALYYPDEAHMATPHALAFLLDAARAAGATTDFGPDVAASKSAERIVDTRGFGARADIKDLRGVRGERLLIRSRDVGLHRPVRLVHPRHPLYVVPWGDGLHLVGATVIESDDASAMTVRSALELLGSAYALHPGFGEAEILEISGGVRPSLPDNMPRARVEGRVIRVNGAWRHGFLLAPVLAAAVARYLSTGEARPGVLDTAA
jgi:glycine oxidase